MQPFHGTSFAKTGQTLLIWQGTSRHPIKASAVTGAEKGHSNLQQNVHKVLLGKQRLSPGGVSQPSQSDQCVTALSMQGSHGCFHPW
jgi:hypothetical protein